MAMAEGGRAKDPYTADHETSMEQSRAPIKISYAPLLGGIWQGA